MNNLNFFVNSFPFPLTSRNECFYEVGYEEKIVCHGCMSKSLISMYDNLALFQFTGFQITEFYV